MYYEGILNKNINLYNVLKGGEATIIYNLL